MYMYMYICTHTSANVHIPSYTSRLLGLFVRSQAAGHRQRRPCRQFDHLGHDGPGAPGTPVPGGGSSTGKL